MNSHLVSVSFTLAQPLSTQWNERLNEIASRKWDIIINFEIRALKNHTEKNNNNKQMDFSQKELRSNSWIRDAFFVFVSLRVYSIWARERNWSGETSTNTRAHKTFDMVIMENIGIDLKVGIHAISIEKRKSKQYTLCSLLFPYDMLCSLISFPPLIFMRWSYSITCAS